MKTTKNDTWDYGVGSRRNVFSFLKEEIHGLAKLKGFWDKERNDGEMIALMHSELSEALEAIRHGNPPDSHVPELSGVEAELADCMIRILDYCGGRGIDIERAIRLKHKYNASRPHKHGKAF